MNGSPWSPSRREQRAEWYLRQTMRYVVGGGGLIWEVAFDKLHNTLALVVFGALGTSTDVISYGRSLIRTANQEHASEEKKKQESEEKAGDSP